MLVEIEMNALDLGAKVKIQGQDGIKYAAPAL